MATLGYVRSSNGPDLAQVGANEQLVSHTFPNTTAETLRITHVSAWVGNWSGTATMRFGIWAASSSSAAPGALLARTVEFSPSVNYVDGAGGQLRTVALETPYDLAPGQVIALGVASRNASAGIAMYQASAISQPNENFYRKGISGTSLQSASGSSASNEGHLAIYVTGTTNDPPNPPVSLTPAGEVTSGTRKPTLTFVHSDPDGDASSQARVQVQRANGSATLWDHTWNVGTPSNSTIYRTYEGSALLYYTEYRFRAQVRDTKGEWGAWSGWSHFTLRHVNSRPNVPSNPSGFGERAGSLTFTFGHDFTDPDSPLLADGQAWERFEAKRVILRRQSDGAVFYDATQPTTSTERANRRSSTTLTLPAWNTLHTITEYHQDRSGAWSHDATRYVRAVTGGSVEKPSSPSGRVTNPANPGVVFALYYNTTGASSTRMRIRLINSNEAVIATSGWVNEAHPPGDAISQPWSAFGLGTMPNGVTRGVQVQAEDTNGNRTPWSDPSWFTTNAAPTKPALNGPVNGYTAPALHPTSVVVNDVDAAIGSLVGTFEYYDATNDTLIGSKTVSWHTGYIYIDSNPGSIISGYGEYKWRARFSDGFLNGPWSDFFTFTYAPVPVVAITAPTGPTITTMQPTITASTDPHVAWRVVGHRPDYTIAYDTGEIPGTFGGHLVGIEQYWRDGERWNNHETFIWDVRVKSAAGLWGVSPELSLTLEYIPPDPLLVESVEAMSFPGCEGTHYIAMQIEQSEHTVEDFLSYNVDRVEIDGPAGNIIDGSLITDYFVEGNSAQTLFTDFDVTSNQWYRYAFRQLIQSGVDVIESEPVYAEMMVSFHGTMLHMPFDPLNTFVWLPYGTEKYEPEAEWFQGGNEIMGANALAPTFYSDGSDYVNWRLESTLIPREGMTTQQQLAAFRRVWSYQSHKKSPNGRPNSVTFREGRGGDDGRVTGRITQPMHRHSYTRLYTIEFEFRELQEDET